MPKKPDPSNAVMGAAHDITWHDVFKQFDAALKWAQECAEEAHDETRSDYHRARAEIEYHRAFDRVEREFHKLEVLAKFWGIDMQPIYEAIDRWMGTSEEVS